MIASLRARLDALEARVNDALPGPVKVGFLTLYLFSTASADRFDALASRPAWDRWADAGVATLLTLQVGGMALVAGAARQALGRTRATALNDPVNTVALPGVNEFMPLAAAPYVVAGLVVATVVHEAGHALVCRRANVAVTEWGVALLFGVLPLAAYVLPDETIDDASVRTKLRMYAVGAFHNVVVAVVALAVLASPLSAGSPLSAYLTYFGWALTGGSPPTAATVASLGVLTNLAFWLALLNANFALLNALPVSVFDGGRVLALALRASADRFGVPLSPLAESAVVHGASLLAVALVVVAVLGPALPV
ncbi:site-2 protease family protein [Halorussus gelatinilyticus]|uniref:Site-2 protease family protein n=1 Tax=Halorussus gelatinilyticus TaxID=2937524 RepID=A0A8U0IKI1_9EURY|nr:site-2 protease family protein [Halorussus gelatinilyticus]UPW00724.1 site-2 protease family protein [Halorussus gelatinilyticus]